MKRNILKCEHLEEAQESYLQHFVFTMRMAATLLLAGIAVFIHGLFPFLLTRTASSMVQKSYDLLQARRKPPIATGE